MKATNPKDLAASHRISTHVIPSGAIMELALAMSDGDLKYGAHNYRVAPVMASIYYGAIDRHLKKWWEGEEFSDDSGAHHLGHIMAGCAILLDAIQNDMLHDDRPPPMNEAWYEDFNKRLTERMESSPRKADPYTKLNSDSIEGDG